MRSTVVRRLILLFAVGWSMVLPPSVAGAGDGDVARRFEGSWTYAGDADEQQARLDAIDATVAEMFGIARPFARRVMRSNTTNPSSFHIQIDGDKIAVVEEDGEPLWTPLDGTPVVIDGYGAGQQVTRKVVDDTLHARSWQHNGGGTRIFRLSGDGHIMVVTVIIESAQLPNDVVYDLTYSKE